MTARDGGPKFKSRTFEVDMGNSCGKIYFVKDYNEKGRLVRIEPFSKELGDEGKYRRLRDQGGGCAIIHLKHECRAISKSLRNGMNPEKYAREYLLDIQCERGNKYIGDAENPCGYSSCLDALGWQILD